ncbi:Uncharacterized protein dnm_053300 [Desulfonema magnum]|uniref:Uncharacterized protein n=1 Tax=Desulfonema magnum TaxID=45655 RepID=A0A975GPX3_9BACT|nr:Uncharacterized protein dnm_053300 [Desulfonema magnum]
MKKICVIPLICVNLWFKHFAGRGCKPARDVFRITAKEPFGRGCKPRPATLA